MNEMVPSFGRAALQLKSSEALLHLENEQNKKVRFTAIDALGGNLLVRSLRGERVVEIIQRKEKEYTIAIQGLNDADRAFIENTFRLDQQQARGAWFLPSDASLRVGMIHFPANFRQLSRFASISSWEEHCRVAFAHSADALFFWAVLEPLFETLMLPLLLRSRLTGSRKREDQLKSWRDVDLLLEALGFSVADELAVMRYGGGWSKLRSQEHHAAKQRFLIALARQVKPEMAALYRAYCIRLLLDQYYKKAKGDGRAIRKQVLTKPLERMLAGYFGGDWLAFLDYIGEEPHADEQIVTALPETRIHVGGASEAKVAAVAAQMGVATEEVERMMAAYWQQSTGKSPVISRVDVLSRYWQIFDELHARQSRGMKPLWGLVEDHRSFDFYNHLQSPYQPRLYLDLLPKAMLSDIEQLWGAIMLPRWPDRIISEPFPHSLLIESLGPALKFWHGCALTAWFICEGPSSRTDLAGFAEYYRRETQALKELDTPIDTRLFDELVKAEAKLGLPEPIVQSSSTIKGLSGISITMTTNAGSRRAGFEILRDIITQHRREWTNAYFKQYIRKQWESEIRAAGQSYNQLLHETGKAPTAKQFAKFAEAATNHWFGGDVSQLYGAIREKSPVHPQRVSALPSDKMTFAFAVFVTLGGETYAQRNTKTGYQDFQARKQEWDQYIKLNKLAELSFWYVQLEEGLGHLPSLKEFGPGKFAQPASVINENVDEAWQIFTKAIETAKHSAISMPERYSIPATALNQESDHHTPPQIIAVQQKGTTVIPQTQITEQKRPWLDRLLRRN
ncbi:MAG TPA: hypothetical protein VNG51_01230 [Ktedonobacteraceae bacterium]|nr:hypothetical protein [Ktedonobacteraceae bacterium]